MRWFILTFCLCFVLQTGWVQASEESLHYGRFGKVTLYRESPVLSMWFSSFPETGDGTKGSLTWRKHSLRWMPWSQALILPIT